jgi:hypothetical protein
MTKSPAGTQPIISILDGTEISNSQHNIYKALNEADEEQTEEQEQVLASAVN